MRTLVALFVVAAVGSTVRAESEGDRTMTKVVKLLQEMLDTSQADGRADTEIFAKFKCYCDSNTASKQASIAHETSQISTFEGAIETLSASSGKLSTEVATLDQGMTDNQAARDDADKLREKANADFKAEEADSIAAIDQMDNALETLSAVGADQTAGLVAVHSHTGKFMAGQTQELSDKAKRALRAASVFLPPADRKKFTGFIQAPFTGEYSAQSGEIVGILKNMRDTFKADLATARGAEAKQARLHGTYTATMEAEHQTMDDAHASKQDQLGSNDADLATAKESLASSLSTKADDEEFLASLTQQCADKTRQYEDLKMVRANEEAAIAQAISILNSDAAFESFGATSAASSGATGFVQLRQTTVRRNIKHILEKAARSHKSLRLAKIAAQVEKNPFAMVIKMIKKSMKMIDEEEKKDDETKAFCDDERTVNDANIASLTDSINQLNGEIDQLTTDIEEPEKGLKAVLAARQQDLADNKQSQADETSNRQAENAEYRKNVQNLVVAEETIQKALDVLTKYYDWLERKQGPHHYEEHDGKDSGGSTIKRIPEATVDELKEACSADPNCAGFNTNGVLKSGIAEEGEWYDTAGKLFVKTPDAAFTQLRKEDPAPPTEEFKGGQEEKGHKALDMLTFILSETKAEEKTAHENEEKAQADYEDFMTDAKKNENDLLTTIAQTEESLAAKEKERTLKTMNRNADEKEKKAAEDYLASIKPGCDFMDQNIDARKGSRRAEKSALTDSLKLMTNTPEYQTEAAAEEAAALGACADACVGRLEHAECKACQGDTTVAGYCTSNPDTEGC